MFAFFKSDVDRQHQLDAIVAELVATTGLAQNQLAITWVVYTDPVIVNTGGALSAAEFWQHQPCGATYRGLEPMAPAELAQLVYLVAAHEWLEQGMTPPSAELDRALQAMTILASYDATSLVVDTLTGTTSGPELPPGPAETWVAQRNLINRYVRSLQWPEFETTNINQKLWAEGAYGRERIFWGDRDENQNVLTTNAIARLLHSIIGGVAVSAPRSQLMMAALRRDLTPSPLIHGFLGQALPPTAQLWSKVGWSPQGRHEAAYIEVPGAPPYLVTVLTAGAIASQNPNLLPLLSQHLLASLT